MIEPEEQYRFKIAPNTALAISGVLLSGISMLMKQEGFPSEIIISNKVFTIVASVTTLSLAARKAWYENKYEYLPHDPKRTERIFKEAIRESIIAVTNIVIQGNI